MPLDTDSGSRQQQIIAILLRHGPITIAELADELGLAKTSLRPQLDRLVLQGWLDRDRRRQGPGRPADVFSASYQSRQLFAQRTLGEFAHLLLDEVADTETRSKVRSVVGGVGRRLTDLFRSIVGEGPPAERIRRLSEFLTERGILNDTKHSRQAITLNIHTCPYVGLAGEHEQICAMHRDSLAEVLGGATCSHHCRSEGHPHCEFQVKVASSKPAPGGRRRPPSTRSKKTAKRRR